MLIMKDLSIITVTHQSALFIEDLVFSVPLAGTLIESEHMIVDNGSTDGTVEILKGLTGYLKEVILNEENLGFSVANHQGISLSEGRYFLFLNPDMCLKEGSLDQMVQWMDAHQEVGIASCLLVDVFGRPLKVGRPRRLPVVWREVLWLLRCHKLLREEINMEIGKEWREVEMVKGAFMLVRRSLVEELNRAFDLRYFLMFEDADLCQEARQRGYRVAHLPFIECIDLNSRSFAVKSGPWIYEHFTRGMLSYFRKWEPWYLWVWIACCIPIGKLLRFPLFLLRKGFGRLCWSRDINRPLR